MHELSIAEALVQQVRRHAPPGAKVKQVKLRIGPLRGIEEQAMHWAWSAATADSELAGSQLEMEMLPWPLHCNACNRNWAGKDLYELCSCGQPATLNGGDELDLTALEIE